jgi:hypothetical protein
MAPQADTRQHMIDRSLVLQSDLIDIDFVRPMGGMDTRPVLHRPTARIRSPLMEPLSETSRQRTEAVAFELPPIRELIVPVAWLLVAGLPILVRVGWQAAVVAGVIALILREGRLRADRSTLSFGDGFLAYAGTNGWPHGVQEDDDVRWNWAAVRPARRGQESSG